jgi:hypothetical protein
MGFFYANITLQTSKQQDVALYLNTLQQNAFVLPATRGFVVVCDENSDAYDTEITKQLSERFICTAISVINVDDDILRYQLYQNGNLLDVYNSNPDYFESNEHRGPIGGNANILCKIFNKPNSVEKVEKILLAPPSDCYILENDRHSDLAKTLGWDSPYLFLSYRELIKGDLGKDDPPLFAKPLSRRELKQFTDSYNTSKTFDLDKEILKLLRRKKKISAILLYQQQKICSVTEAKSYVDELEKRG